MKILGSRIRTVVALAITVVAPATLWVVSTVHGGTHHADLSLRQEPVLADAGVAVAGANDAAEAVTTATQAAQPDTQVVPAAAHAAPEPTEGGLSCPEGMVLVDGEYCPEAEEQCLRWAPDEVEGHAHMRCLEFAPSKCDVHRRHMAYCIDRFEYPNRPGAYPAVMMNWYQARNACAAEGKRLCSGSEWTFACEGEDMLPYPYGRERDNTACNIDHQTRHPDRPRLADPATSVDEATRLYEAAPSGAYPACVSPFGVYDMTGNVDEWTVNETGEPFQSELKGGWWGPVRTRCRPATTAHNESFNYYQIGFRCCADAR